MAAELIDDPLRAAELLRLGKLIAFPTETVYGLGVDATNAAAVARLFQAKGRPTNNPLIVHVADFAQANLAARDIPPIAYELMHKFSPGPLTVVVPKREEIEPAVTAGLHTVGLRVPDHALTRSMLAAAGLPIAAPSANRSGKPSATTWQAVLEDLGEAIDGILVSDPARVGLESTVVDCLSNPPRVLRPGGVSLEQLQTIVPSMTTAGPKPTAGENSPGRLHPHYRPLARVEVVDHAEQITPAVDAAFVGIHPPAYVHGWGWIELYPTVEQYAQGFYEALREVDRRGLKLVYLQRVPLDGIGAALQDRIARAAEHPS